jgi:hypothetical protein
MLDPGRYLAEAIYFLQYTLAQILWAISRATLSIAIIAESVNTWITDNIGYFVDLLVNGLSAPLGGLFILALTALGVWYALNNIIPTSRWVDPSKLFSYGLIAFFFFSSPIVVIDMMEDLRQSLNAGIDAALIDGAAGDIFESGMNGTDAGLPGAIPDVNSDGVIGSFDLVAAFMMVANMDELDSSEFPVDFEAAFFPFGDPSGIDLSDEADQELAKALASDGIERLFFALVAIPTAISEHFLRLALTGVAMFLYAGVPIAMLFSFFIYTQAFLGAYLKQFINLLIETFMSVIIVAILIGLLVSAARQGIGLYIGASIITFIVILWRIKSALKLGTAAFDLFGGAAITGGSGGMALVDMGRRAATGAAALAGAALTGGATMAVGGAVLASAAALRADGNGDGAYLGTDPDKTDGRVQQLKTIAGYALGRSETVRHVIEGAHEARTLARNFRDGEVQEHDPDMLDFMRAGSSMSGFGSSPWLAMRTSPSLRGAFDQIGGSRHSARDAAFDGDQAIHTLTRVLMDPETAVSAHRQPEETENGPIPDWLREGMETTEDESSVQDVNIVSAAPDPSTGSGQALDHDGREDKYEIPDARTAGSIRLEPYQPSRRQVIYDTLARLAEPRSLAGQAARSALVTYTGARNAGLLEEAVGQHTAAAVQEATAATADLIARYREQGMGDADQLAAFQSGEAAAAIRESVDTPLSDEQLLAVADMVMLPQRRLTRPELVAIIGQEAAAGAASEQAVIEALAIPIGFGGQTGNVRGVLAGARTMALSPAELARLAEMIQDGLRDEAQAELVGRGYQPGQVSAFVTDMAALPAAMTLPQTTSMTPKAGGPTAVNPPQTQEK